jgi:choline/glycine/proline betaine transport protein
MRKPRQYWSRLIARMEPAVFFSSALLVVGFCLFGGLFTDTAATVFAGLQAAIINAFGWFYALVVTVLLAACLWLALGRFAHVKLGRDDSRPEFGYLAWFAMLFSAGMGTGIVFWGVAEPLYHYGSPPSGESGTPQAARLAMQYAFFHWGLHAWAIYALFGVALAYFHFRVDKPLAPRSVFYPLLGGWADRWPGHAVDTLCTVGTLLGVATSLGLGAMQLNSGLATFTGIPVGTAIQVLIIALITTIALVSVVSGIHAGIRRLSVINLAMSGGLLLFVLLAGPTVYLLETFVGSLGLYLQKLPLMSLWVDFSHEDDWQANWTFFYWGWWISWSPFVGVFVARISRGRSIREFMASVLLVPSLGTFFWMAVFGGSALHEQMHGSGELLAVVQDDVAVSLHALLETLPLSSLSLVFASLVIVVFFVTSSDSGSLVDDMVTSGGHPNPPRAQRVFWATAEGAVAATLLIVGGLTAIQHASIAMGFLMSFVLLAAGLSLARHLLSSAEP